MREMNKKNEISFDHTRFPKKRKPEKILKKDKVENFPRR